MQKRSLVIAVTLIVTASILLAFLVLPSILAPPPPTSVPLLKAGNASYATGSGLSGNTFQRAVVVTGAFVTDASATVRIQQSNYPPDVDGCQASAPTPYCYTTGDVSRAILDTTLQAGSYRLLVTFTNDTTVQTWFNVTQGFVATYQK